MPLSVRRDLSQAQVTLIRGITARPQHVVSSRATGSRTIIHHRELDELSEDDIVACVCGEAGHPLWRWVHLEGRSPPAVVAALQRIRGAMGSSSALGGAPTMLSLEIEKPKYVEGLLPALPFVDVCMVSREAAQSLGFADGSSCLLSLAQRVKRR